MTRLDWLSEDLPPGTTHRILLLRHGRPHDDARGRCYGKLDVGLSDAGRQEIRTLRAATGGALPSVVVSSPRVRARESAELLVGASVDHFEEDSGIAEFDFGDFEGLSYCDVEARFPDVFKQWMADPTEVQFPGGESHREMQARVMASAARIRTRWRGVPVLVSTHGGVIRTWVAAVLGMPRAHLFRLDVAHASLTCVDFYEDSPVVRTLSWRPP